MLENGLIALFVLWSAIAVCFALRIYGPRRAFARFNWFSAWVRWGLFNSDDPSVRPGAFEVEYRDRTTNGEATPWTTGLTGFFWCWHAGLWCPERRIADGVQHFGKCVRSALDAGEAPSADIARQAAAIERRLREQAPPPPGSAREFRLVRRIHSLGAEPVFTFAVPLATDGR